MRTDLPVGRPRHKKRTRQDAVAPAEYEWRRTFVGSAHAAHRTSSSAEGRQIIGMDLLRAAKLQCEGLSGDHETPSLRGYTCNQ